MNKNKSKVNTNWRSQSNQCHTRPDRVSMDSRIQSENDKYIESGRSLTEMLATLAVIGVLSIAGIAGYNMAMNKHKANDVLNAASQRAMVVAIQIQNGATSLSLAEFSGETVQGVSFDSAEAVSGATQFKLNLSSVAPEVCAQMKTNVGDNSNVDIADCPTETGSLVLTYNNDLSAPVEITVAATTSYDGATSDDDSDCSSDTRLGGASGCQVCSKGNWIDSDAKCTNAGSSCVDGTCTTPSTTCPFTTQTCDTDLYCSVDYTFCESDSDCIQYKVENNMCVRDTDETACGKNSDCASGEFCNYKGLVDCKNGPDGKVGVCENAGSSAYTEITSSDYTKMSSGSTWILSSQSLDWFSAKNFCLANHMQMVNLSDIGCTTSTCETSTNDNSWNVFKGSGSHLASVYLWTKAVYGAGSCYAYYVTTSGEEMGINGRNYDRSALCK